MDINDNITRSICLQIPIVTYFPKSQDLVPLPQTIHKIRIK
eukprot:UN09492